jgi:hypothetical protein
MPDCRSPLGRAFRGSWSCMVMGYTMLSDLVVDLAVSVLLSRQVVDVGAAGVG